MKFILYLITFGLLAAACNEKARSSAPAASLPAGIPINASGFARVSSAIEAEIMIDVNPDSPYHCYLQCEKAVEPLIAFDISNDELHIVPKENAEIVSAQPIRIHLRVKELKSLTSKGSGSIEVHGKNITDLFELKSNGSAMLAVHDLHNNETRVNTGGSGSITLGGQTKNLNVKLLGSGNLNAYGLKTDNAVASVTGSGNMEVNVDYELDASILGSGNIFYKGSPVIKNNITGSGLLTAK